MRPTHSTIVLIIFITACSKLVPSGPDSDEILAEPITGMAAEYMNQFLIGDEAFAHTFSVEEGLGPIYIQNACESCHVGDGKGHPENIITRFGRWDNKKFDYLLEVGGPQLQHRSINNYPSEVLPTNATAVTQRVPPLVTGMGYLAMLSDQTILDLADPDDLDSDGISGRVNYIFPNENFEAGTNSIDSSGYYIGRFGKKAKEIRLIDQIVFALREDIGLSSDLSMIDLKHHQHIAGDKVAEPEVPNSTIEALAFYMHALKAPSRRNQEDPDVQAGEALFASIGCVKCHIPTLTTGSSTLDFLDHKIFHPYTDLLLHDMGPELDDSYPEGSAKSSEWRTPPLWGLGLASTTQGAEAHLLHDGRAKTIPEAIGYHVGGEARTVALKYYQLDPSEKEQLIKFLNSL
jgi:CxxC motif-containing protein (DUF1111 family)